MENPETGIEDPKEVAEGEEAAKEVVEGEHTEGEHVEGEHGEGELGEGEQAEGEHVEGEHVEGEHAEGEQVEGEHVEGEEKDKQLGEGEELAGEEIPDLEKIEAEQSVVEKPPEEEPPIEEEEQYVEEPPPDPTAPYNLSDSQEALKPKFELRPDQLAEVEQLWELYQDYTPAYSNLDNFITEKELVYMLKCLILLPVTPEQLQELIEYCVRPPHPEGHISFDQFVKIVTLRQRSIVIEEELRCALKVFDRDNSGEISRDELKEVLLKQGHKLPQKVLDNLIKEVDLSNDGTLGVEDIVGTMCIDLNPEDLIMLRNMVYPTGEKSNTEED
ncbi:involucrin-like [Cydia amplana]|uniref:involucrin-like n=1 Tax=Cydia amplana TaxID=1869771 RepID=UPI002FE5F98C